MRIFKSSLIRVLFGLILSVIFLPPIIAPIVHNGDTPKSAIRQELSNRKHPYQSFFAIINENGEDEDYGKRYDVIWKDFNSGTGMTPTIFYVKKNKSGNYYVVSSGTGP